jgi:hypothetical protein
MKMYGLKTLFIINMGVATPKIIEKPDNYKKLERIRRY